MIELGLPLNNKPGYVLVEKRKKDVNKFTSGNKGENITEIIFWNSEGRFNPPPLPYPQKDNNQNGKINVPWVLHSDVKQLFYFLQKFFSKWLENHFILVKHKENVSWW